MSTRGTQSGVTLIEMLVALSVFSLIGLASFAVLDTIVRTDRQSSGRLEQLADIEKAFRLFQIDATRAETWTSLSPARLTLVTGAQTISYLTTEGGVIRTIDQEGLATLEQRLLPAPMTASWRVVGGGSGGGSGRADAVEFLLMPDSGAAGAVRYLAVRSDVASDTP